MACKKYKSIVEDDYPSCIYFDEETTEIGLAKYCSWYDRILYNLRDVGCPHRPKYSDEVRLSASTTKRDENAI